MRFPRVFAIVGTVAALASVSACGLPSAGSTEDAGEFLTSALGCKRIDPISPRHLQLIQSRGVMGINGGGACEGAPDGGYDVDFMTIEDMESFQNSLKQKGGGEDDLMIGDDFAVAPASDAQRRKLLDAGLLFLNCSPNFKAPEGKTVDEGEVEGCAVTDYSEDLD
ncbi:hypothetical protein [Streptomyces chattanoogensis]|uniref:hypothetical protein n=1 Tax=Streptomyces chattanoogensis TaxID=66876 RepID=UPI000696E149|nr:hypothetical protein T261_1461 [Streptomyces lydicus]